MPAMLPINLKNLLLFRNLVLDLFRFRLKLVKKFSKGYMICSRLDWFSKVIAKSFTSLGDYHFLS